MVGGPKFSMSSGFTLIEITIVLAIVSGIAIIAFLGQGEFRSKARFTDAVDRTVSALTSAQNEANSAINTRDDAGTDDSQIFFGMLASFDADAGSVMEITPYWRNGQSCPPTEDLKPKQGSAFEIPSGVEFDSTLDQSVMFGRSCFDGRPKTYIPDIGSTLAELLRPQTYLSAPANPAVIKLSDFNGHCAEITIQPGTGSIGKEYMAC